MITIRIAGHTFSLDNRYTYIADLCRHFLTDDSPEAIFQVSDSDCLLENQDNGSWPIEQLESRAFHRKICSQLLGHDIMLFHSAAIKYDNKAYLFAAPSGTGKTTHCRLWRQRYPIETSILNGDTPLLHFATDQIIAYGTPWSGKENLHSNDSAAVGAIVLLHQSKVNIIRQMNPAEAYPRILEQSFRSNHYDTKEMRHTMILAKRLAEVIPIYSLGCNISIAAAELCHDTITNNRP